MSELSFVPQRIIEDQLKQVRQMTEAIVDPGKCELWPTGWGMLAFALRNSGFLLTPLWEASMRVFVDRQAVETGQYVHIHLKNAIRFLADDPNNLCASIKPFLSLEFADLEDVYLTGTTTPEDADDLQLFFKVHQIGLSNPNWAPYAYMTNVKNWLVDNMQFTVESVSKRQLTLTAHLPNRPGYVKVTFDLTERDTDQHVFERTRIMEEPLAEPIAKRIYLDKDLDEWVQDGVQVVLDSQLGPFRIGGDAGYTLYFKDGEVDYALHSGVKGLIFDISRVHSFRENGMIDQAESVYELILPADHPLWNQLKEMKPCAGSSG